MRLARPAIRPLVPAAALLAAACGDAPSPQEPRPSTRASPGLAGRDGAPVRRDAAALLGSATHWADGYLEAHSSTAALETPGPTYSFNRAGRGTITVTKPSGTTGRYVATFGGLSATLGGRSAVRVTGLSGGATYCKLAGAYLASDKVEVRCFESTTGLPVNSQFSLLVTRGYPDLAFAYAHLSTGTNYTPDARGSWNPAGTSTVARSGVGQYRVTFNNLGAQLPPGTLGHVQVNAVGTSNAYCNPYNWYTSGTPNLSVDVRCFEAPSGALVDRRFTVLFVLPSEHLAYAWADKPTVGTYAPFPDYSANPAGGTITLIRGGPGAYHTNWAGAGNEIIQQGNVQVSAFGSNAQCKGYRGSPDGVRVGCFAPNGAPVDSRYQVLLGS